MLDFSRLRTLDDVQAERMRLEQDVAKRQQRVWADVQGIRQTLRSRKAMADRVLRAIGYVLPTPSRKTLLGLAGSAILARLFRRRK